MIGHRSKQVTYQAPGENPDAVAAKWNNPLMVLGDRKSVV